MKRKAQNKRYHTVSGQLPPRKIARLLGLGFGLGLGLEIGLVGGAFFLGANCPRTLPHTCYYFDNYV